MSDEIDAELLALAGDSSDDEGDIDASKDTNARSATPDAPRQTTEKTEDAPKAQRGVAQKVKGRKRRQRRESSEVDNASPSPASSQRSSSPAAMRASEIEVDAASPSPPADAPLYPLEGRFTSAKDREDILALPEIEREGILAERAHEVTRKKQDMQLKRALATTKALGSKAKRKAEEEHEDGSRRTTRPKTEKSGKSALEDYKRAREQKGSRREADTTYSRRQDSRSPSHASDRDAEGESEVEWPEPARESRRDEPPASLKEFERCKIGRSNFSKVCFNPLFNATAKGCFARVSVGWDKVKGQNEYRVAQIKGFTEGKPYQLETSNGKSFTLDTYAIMSQGSSEKPYQFLSCSDGRITPDELARFEAQLGKENKKLPSQNFVQSKIQDINKMLEHRWTDADIQKRLDTMATLEKKYAKPTRGELIKRKADAEERGDSDEISKLEAQLSALDNAAKTAHKSPPKSKAIQEQERLAAFNRNTRKHNTETVRRAILEDKRKNEEWVANKIKERQAKEAAERARREEELFGGGGDENGTAEVKKATSRGATPNGEVKKKKDVKGLPLGSLRGKATTDDDVLGDMDLGLEIDI
ncbi:hypothetical protein MBLNU230_g4082t1 [Neophaeotheca triangularis]